MIATISLSLAIRPTPTLELQATYDTLEVSDFMIVLKEQATAASSRSRP